MVQGRISVARAVGVDTLPRAAHFYGACDLARKFSGLLARKLHRLFALRLQMLLPHLPHLGRC
jgi:hypothetical protein